MTPPPNRGSGRADVELGRSCGHGALGAYWYWVQIRQVVLYVWLKGETCARYAVSKQGDPCGPWHIEMLELRSAMVAEPALSQTVQIIVRIVRENAFRRCGAALD